MSTICTFSQITVKGFHQKCQPGVGRWSSMGKIWSTQFVDAPQGERGAFQCRVGVQFLLSGVHNEPGIFFAFCTNRLRREISTPKASHDSFAVMNKGKRPEKLFSKTFLAFKSPFHQDFLATSRITFLAVNSQKVVPCKGQQYVSTKRSHLYKERKE